MRAAQKMNSAIERVKAKRPKLNERSKKRTYMVSANAFVEPPTAFGYHISIIIWLDETQHDTGAVNYEPLI